ncbi:oligopeptide transport ATP-binding protein OppD [Cutibacterium acnes JCM 18920]|nr:oligopeptide transport ATP-binding protein OppD [Cutibacterium acnes JCM 18920]
MSKKTATAAHLSDALPERQEGVPVLQIRDLTSVSPLRMASFMLCVG